MKTLLVLLILILGVVIALSPFLLCNTFSSSFVSSALVSGAGPPSFSSSLIGEMNIGRQGIRFLSPKVLFSIAYLPYNADFLLDYDYLLPCKTL